MVTETTPAPVETVTPIKPSEAIRLGCLIAPVQGTGSFWPGEGMACALGAMALGFGYDGPRCTHPYGGCGCERTDPYLFVEARLPRERVEIPGHPHGDRTEYADAIYQLNDSFGWTRERIADWLAEQGL